MKPGYLSGLRGKSCRDCTTSLIWSAPVGWRIGAIYSCHLVHYISPHFTTFYSFYSQGPLSFNLGTYRKVSTLSRKSWIHMNPSQRPEKVLLRSLAGGQSQLKICLANHSSTRWDFQSAWSKSRVWNYGAIRILTHWCHVRKLIHFVSKSDLDPNQRWDLWQILLKAMMTCYVGCSNKRKITMPCREP